MQRLNCGTVELQDKDYSVCGIRTAELKVTAYSLCGSGTMELQVIEYSVCGSGTSSHIIFCVARMIRERRGHRPLGQSHLEGAVIYCSILTVAPTGIFVCFLRYYEAVTTQLTYYKDPDIRQTSWPKAAGTKLPIQRRVLNPVLGS